jgi:hypothetical protein
MEAAGHTGGNSGMGGDLLYRWGNPQTYHRGNDSDQRLFVPHDAHWIESDLPGEGNILIFNNGRKRPGGNYSSIDEISPTIMQNGNYSLNSDSRYQPDTILWTYTDPDRTSFFASNLSGAQRLPNGNTLICDGPKGIFFEVSGEEEIIWKYINPVIRGGPIAQGDILSIQENRVFKIYRYGHDYPGFADQELTAGDPIELYPSSNRKNRDEFNSEKENYFKLYPNPTSKLLSIEILHPEIPSIEIASLSGDLLRNEKMEGSTHQLDLSTFERGVYLITIRSKDFVSTRKIIKL